MKTNRILALSAVALGMLFATSANAGWSVGISIGAPVYQPVPRPAYPPPVVYLPPRPVYPPVVLVPPGHARRGYWTGRHRPHWADRCHCPACSHGGRGTH